MCAEGAWNSIFLTGRRPVHTFKQSTQVINSSPLYKVIHIHKVDTNIPPNIKLVADFAHSHQNHQVFASHHSGRGGCLNPMRTFSILCLLFVLTLGLTETANGHSREAKQDKTPLEVTVTPQPGTFFEQRPIGSQQLEVKDGDETDQVNLLDGDQVLEHVDRNLRIFSKNTDNGNSVLPARGSYRLVVRRKRRFRRNREKQNSMKVEELQPSQPAPSTPKGPTTGFKGVFQNAEKLSTQPTISPVQQQRKESSVSPSRLARTTTLSPDANPWKTSESPSIHPSIPTTRAPIVPLSTGGDREGDLPSPKPSQTPTYHPTRKPTNRPSQSPTVSPTVSTDTPTSVPTKSPTWLPTLLPTSQPTFKPQEAVAPTDITKRTFETTLNLDQVAVKYQDAFRLAAKRWSSVIVGDLPDAKLTKSMKASSRCENIPDIVDDIYICSRIIPIDGKGGVLGSAGPDFGRNTGGHVMTVLGTMQFDSADVDSLARDGTFNNVIVSIDGMASA